MATKLGDLTVGADGSWSSGPHTMTSGSKSVTVRRKSDGAVLVTRSFTVASASAITHVATGSGKSNVVPASRQAGDILVVVRNNNVALTGYTLEVSDPSLGIYWRRATGDASDNIGTQSSDIIVSAYRGCVASGSPIDAKSASVATGDGMAGNMTIPQITTLTANAWVLAAMFGVDGGWDDQEGGTGPNTGGTATAPSGPATTVRATVYETAGNPSVVQLAADAQAAAGATGAEAMRFYTDYAYGSGGTPLYGALVALKPA